MEWSITASKMIRVMEEGKLKYLIPLDNIAYFQQDNDGDTTLIVMKESACNKVFSVNCELTKIADTLNV